LVSVFRLYQDIRTVRFSRAPLGRIAVSKK